MKEDKGRVGALLMFGGIIDSSVGTKGSNAVQRRRKGAREEWGAFCAD